MIASSLVSLLLAVTSFSFDVTATGVEKGTPLEFMFAGRTTDRDYETMFLLDETIESFCKRLEEAGLPRGRPTDIRACRFWPVGCTVTLKPALDKFVKSELPEGLRLGSLIYTGGTRTAKGVPVAETNMPSAVFGLYTLAQSSLLFNGNYEQSVVYGSHTAAQTLKKGEKVRFTLEWSNARLPVQLAVVVKPGGAREVLQKIKASADKGETDVLVSFDDALTIQEGVAVAQALSVLDSPLVKINGRVQDGFFYRAFLPLVKWKDRKERLVQPFEVSVTATNETLTVIHEDWSGEGTDPKLTAAVIPFDRAGEAAYAQIDTCFFIAPKVTTVGRLRQVLKRLPKTVINTYIYGE